MRITPIQREAIRKITAEVLGEDAVVTAQQFVPTLTDVTRKLQAELQKRRWAGDE